MTDEQITVYLTEWVKDYCHNDFLDASGVETLPGGVILFLERGLDFQKRKASVTSETLGDYSISFGDGYPDDMLKLLRPYRRARGVDDSGTSWK